MPSRYTFAQFDAQFPDDDACLAAIMRRRYGDKPVCPKCGIADSFSRISGRRAFACQCGYHVYPCAGTEFEHSSTSLKLWFHAMYLMTATRNGVSAKELERQLGVTYKCAWRVGHQLRKLMASRAMSQNPGPMAGHLELDECYVGGKSKGKSGRGKGKYLQNKTTVFGIVQRKGDFRGWVVPNEKKETLVPIIEANIAKKSLVSTDHHRSYKGLKKLGYKHGSVNHQIDEWVKGIHHTNTIEGFWSHLKKGIRSTHVSVSRRYLENYVREFGFRFNNRHEPAEMFTRLLAHVSKATS